MVSFTSLNPNQYFTYFDTQQKDMIRDIEIAYKNESRIPNFLYWGILAWLGALERSWPRFLKICIVASIIRIITFATVFQHN